MNAIHIRKQIDSETLFLPEVRPLIGQTVDIIILEGASQRNGSSPENRFLALAPKEEPLTPQEIEAMRADPQFRRFWPLLELAGQDIIDADAIASLRAASVI